MRDRPARELTGNQQHLLPPGNIGRDVTGSTEWRGVGSPGSKVAVLD